MTPLRYVRKNLQMPLWTPLTLLLLEDQSAVPLAAAFLATFRKHLAKKGGRPC